MFQTIYDKSMTIDATLDWLSEVVVVDDVSISNRLKGIEYDRQEMLKSVNIDTYELAQVGLNVGLDSKNKLESILRDSFLSYVRSGALRATARVASGSIEYVAPFDWAFLEMDFQRDCVIGKEKKFAQVRIIQDFKLSEHELSFLNNGVEKSPHGGLAIFMSMKSLTAIEVTVCLLRKDESSLLPDRLKVSARNNKRTVSCESIGLTDKRTGMLNRAGQMLITLEKGTIPENIKAPEQAMKELRKIFRNMGIIDKDPFHPKRACWKPRFTLVDGIDQANKRAADRAIHIQFNDKIAYKQEEDEGGEWLKNNDKTDPS